jgi:Zn-dependent protease/CBS domain-containing protein
VEASFSLGRIKGIPIGIHYSWLLIFAIITWALSSYYFPSQYPHWPSYLSVLVGVTTSLLFFASVLLHELAHSFVAMRDGIQVKSITLFIFGGVAQIGQEARSPESELRIAIAGPLSSVVLAAFFGALWLASREFLEPLAALARYLGTINLLLAGFNLLPGFPLDGGRVLRAIIWRIKGRFVAATRVASLVGRAVAYLFIMGGLLLIFTGSLFNGIWFIFIGWFLSNAAEASYRQVLMQDMLRGIPVSALMTRDYQTVSPDLRLDTLVTDYVMRHHLHAFPTVEGSRLVGIITLHDIKRTQQERWPFTTVAEAMTRAEDLKTLSPRDDIGLAFQLLNENQIGQLPVLEAGMLVGLVTRTDLMHYIHMRSELKV